MAMSSAKKEVVKQMISFIRKQIDVLIVKKFRHLDPEMVDEVIGLNNIRSAMCGAFTMGVGIGSDLKGSGIDSNQFFEDLLEIIEAEDKE